MEKNTVCFEGSNIEDQKECDRAVKALKLKEEGAVMALSCYSSHDEEGFKFLTQKFGHFISIWKIMIF